MLERVRIGAKDPHAVALGRRGGAKGGRARAERLSAAERSAIASRAAKARWNREASKKAPASAVASDPARTIARVLRAASQEFQAAGFAGARVDRIAARARVNKRTLYRYFTNKEGLFKALLARSAERMLELEAAAPADLGEALVFWRDALLQTPTWMRLSVFEAIHYGERFIVSRAEREKFWKMSVDEFRALQGQGALSPLLDAEQLQLALIALVAFPIVLPQLAVLITGHGPGSPEFQAKQAGFLRVLAERLA